MYLKFNISHIKFLILPYTRIPFQQFLPCVVTSFSLSSSSSPLPCVQLRHSLNYLGLVPCQLWTLAFNLAPLQFCIHKRLSKNYLHHIFACFITITSSFTHHCTRNSSHSLNKYPKLAHSSESLKVLFYHPQLSLLLNFYMLFKVQLEWYLLSEAPLPKQLPP